MDIPSKTASRVTADCEVVRTQMFMYNEHYIVVVLMLDIKYKP